MRLIKDYAIYYVNDNDDRATFKDAWCNRIVTGLDSLLLYVRDVIAPRETRTIFLIIGGIFSKYY